MDKKQTDRQTDKQTNKQEKSKQTKNNHPKWRLEEEEGSKLCDNRRVLFSSVVPETAHRPIEFCLIARTYL